MAVFPEGVCKVFGTNFGPFIVVRGLRATPSFIYQQWAWHGDPALQWTSDVCRELYTPPG